jgi:hypothetical protein
MRCRKTAALLLLALGVLTPCEAFAKKWLCSNFRFRLGGPPAASHGGLALTPRVAGNPHKVVALRRTSALRATDPLRSAGPRGGWNRRPITSLKAGPSGRQQTGITGSDLEWRYVNIRRY